MIETISNQNIQGPITLENGTYVFSNCTVDAGSWSIAPGRQDWMVRVKGRCTASFRNCVFRNMTGDYIRGILATRASISAQDAISTVICEKCKFENFVAVAAASQTDPWRFDVDAICNTGSWTRFTMGVHDCLFDRVDGRFVKSQNPGTMVSGGYGISGPKNKCAVSLQESGGTVDGFTAIGQVFRDSVFQAGDTGGGADTAFRNNRVFSFDSSTDVFESKQGKGSIRVKNNVVVGQYRNLYRISPPASRLIIED
jgi:hypothetical protein